MDLNQIKNKLNSLTKQNEGREKKDYTKIFWSPSVGKHDIRIVPSKSDASNPFTEVKVYYGIGKNKMMVSPLTFGEPDPIHEFSEHLRKDYNKENFAIVKKLYPKVRIFVPVIVRGEEEKGVRLWQFGKKIYEDLLNMATDEEIGDFTDIVSGTDMKVTVVDKEFTGTGFNKTTIMPKRSSSKLSSNKKEVELWLEEQPDPLEQFHRFTYEEMKESLSQWLEPETEGSEEDDDMDLDSRPTQATKKYTEKQAPAKTSKKDEWSDLFDDKE